MNRTWQRVAVLGAVMAIGVMVVATAYRLISGHGEPNAVYSALGIVGGIGLLLAFVVAPILHHRAK